MQQTNVDRALAALEEQYADDPERATVLRRTRQFKASWLELAEALAEVKRAKSWERWGFDSYETYFKSELKLRQETVDKLTGSYMFLHKRAPEILKRDPLDAPMPSYQAVDFLRRAEERAAEDESVSEDTLTDIRKRVLEDGTPIATVARLYKDTLFPVSESERLDKDKKDIKHAATKLRDLLLGDTKAVPRRLASETAETLARLLEELSDEANAA